MYLLRQTFMVPKASSYYGSVLAYTSTALLAMLAINGHAVQPEGPLHYWHLAVEQYLHPGRNVVTGVLVIYAAPLCNGLDDSITLRMTGLRRPNALVLTWHSVPGAARYDVQVWLVQAAPGQTITSDSEVNIARQTTGPSATLDDAAMPSGTYQWRTAAVNAHGSLISGWTPAQTISLS
jgi:hypothetical protein